jgi:GDP-L-fucose synthase
VNSLKKEKILLLGPNGLVGSAILRKLNKLGYSNVISLSRKSLDLLNHDAVKKKLVELNPKYIINAAAKVGNQSSNILEPMNFLTDNLKIQMNIYGSLENIDVKKIVNFASIYIYPENRDVLITEESLLTGVLNKNYESYALAKILGIKYLEMLYKTRSVLSATLVLPNVYGINDCLDLNKARFIASVFLKLQSNGTVHFQGSGKQIREFINSEDVADAAVYFMNSKDNEGLVNIGNDEYYEIHQIVKKINSIVPRASKYFWTENDSILEERPFLVSKNKMRSLGWYPKVNLDSGLTSFHIWLASNAR